MSNTTALQALPSMRPKQKIIGSGRAATQSNGNDALPCASAEIAVATTRTPDSCDIQIEGAAARKARAEGIVAAAIADNPAVTNASARALAIAR